MLDTDFVIAALDRSDAHHREAAEAIKLMTVENADLLISTINYAEALVRPAENEKTLRQAVDAIAVLGMKPVGPTETIARDAARYRSLGISLADGFALAAAQAHSATVASFDRRVRRAMSELGLALPESLGARPPAPGEQRR